MDSHGYSTWITAHEGNIGFEWLSRPTKREEDSWMSDPHDYVGGEWRFVIISPGDTVFFPSGTVHFVFRRRGAQTFALGGHILQWSGIERWLQVLIDQMRNPDITNEDVAPVYVHAVQKLLKNRIAAGRLDSIGGQAAVATIDALVVVRNLCTMSKCYIGGLKHLC